jgi:hypothetical protein
MSETSLVDRLANLASRNSALEETAAARDARVDLDTAVLVQLSMIIREPLTITDMRGFTLLLSDIAAPEFIPPLVDMIAADADRLATTHQATCTRWARCSVIQPVPPCSRRTHSTMHSSTS